MAWLALLTVAVPGPPCVFGRGDEAVFFERRIRPLLVENCYECHSTDAKEIKGGLLLDSRAGVIKGGNTGPAVVPGLPDASLIIRAVRHTDPELSMPPKKKLSPQQIADLVEWVRMGAPDPRIQVTVASVQSKSTIDWVKAREFWAFRPLRSPAFPAVRQESWPAHEIDRFILARLEKEGVRPGADAEKRVLLRRATYDLVGLPPTPAEMDAFVADASPSAFAKVVERLLSSPHYGERWGRYWLDVVRYADTAGDNSDFPIPQMYRYRNWVISAFNRDMPYDQFVRAQLAGDLWPAASIEEKHERIIATGYIANARRFGSRVDDYPQHLTIEDTIDNVGRTFLGLTISCARCHDHKFDPITAQDYYALYGIFHSTRYPWPGIELEQKQRDLVPLASQDEVATAQKAHQETQTQLDAEVASLQEELKSLEGDEKKNLEKQLGESKKAAEKHKRAPAAFEQAYAVGEGKKIEDVPLQQKGDPAKPGTVVRRHFLTVLDGAELPPEDTTSGRLQLAEWTLAKKNPLAARVMANRIWQYHFGKGIVPTPNDFGKQGKPPTHPELLDWLALRFIDSGWSIKEMHRAIMLSRTYQLASDMSEENRARDANNDLFSAYPRRRLDAEAMRDTLLALGGNLDPAPAGPHPFPPQPEWNFTQHNPFKAVYETKHRSVYLMTQRIQRHPYLAIFDGADPAASTPTRLTSTTPLQALYLLNDAFVHEQSKHVAARLQAQTEEAAARVEMLYRLALARSPEPDELARAQQFLSRVRATLRERATAEDQVEAEAWQAMVRVVVRLNEFVYID